MSKKQHPSKPPLRTCPNCKGEGVVKLPNGDRQDCWVCGGSGYTRVPNTTHVTPVPVEKLPQDGEYEQEPIGFYFSGRWRPRYPNTIITHTPSGKVASGRIIDGRQQ
jgi:ribosomal protein S27AE